ncbi:site-2 protease family protein [Methanocaldococcus fervens]|uniref:Peptidase M50 n=1 Tax=Methanocaldococcus fervens (strain DSM 4213 / JCM 15782 / AG86) TaxID=573064 RepID=C7P676_METFA|nr:site-2 protease family protein [Methanocaldococcus fervens]ACV24058.1 peptidase M50 [Methanocaldococcus fervens AG86]
MNIFKFSEREIIDLTISVLAIAFIFTYPNFSMIVFIISLIAVGSGFIFHELMHRTVARRYGAWSEFRAWYEGLLLALILKIFLGATFIAPGAVYIYKDYLTTEENGKIALAGPITNVALAFIFLILTLGFKPNSLLWWMGKYGFYINLFLAGFNMLPIPPFDGEKVLRWNPIIWAVFGLPLIGYMIYMMFW